MPELKKVSEVLDLDKMIGLEKPFVFDLDQIKNAQISIGKLVQSVTIPVGEIEKLQASIISSASVMDGIKQMRSLMVSVEDAHKAFVDAFAPAKGVSEMIGKIFKQHAEEFQRVADIGNIIRESWIKTIEETNTQTNWQQASEQLRREAATHVPALRQEYEAIVDDLPLALTFTIPKVTATYKSEVITTEEAKGEKIMQLISGLLEILPTLGIKQEKIDQFTSGLTLEAHALPTDQLCWDNLVIDFKRATLRYKDFQATKLFPETQPIKLLACLIRKGGEIAEYVEIAVAIGHRTENQGKKNSEVARYVQQVKQKLIPKLKKAGMTHQEINQMIQPINEIGFVLRKISVTEKSPK